LALGYRAGSTKEHHHLSQKTMINLQYYFVLFLRSAEMADPSGALGGSYDSQGRQDEGIAHPGSKGSDPDVSADVDAFLGALDGGESNHELAVDVNVLDNLDHGMVVTKYDDDDDDDEDII